MMSDAFVHTQVMGCDGFLPCFMEESLLGGILTGIWRYFYLFVSSMCHTLSCFLALYHTFLDFRPTLVSFTLSCDMQVLAWNQDQDTKIANSLISNLFWFTSRELSKACNEITKQKRTLRVQLQINTCTTKSLLSKQTESILNKSHSMQLK